MHNTEQDNIVRSQGGAEEARKQALLRRLLTITTVEPSEDKCQKNGGYRTTPTGGLRASFEKGSAKKSFEFPIQGDDQPRNRILRQRFIWN
jgi:hypothetical protein